jgi:O-methyltransferase involved in polyketide biosynthesis
LHKEKGGLVMQTLGVVEDTLFVPMLGRIYASEHYPQILYDKKALER